ncbi:PAS domain S-box protein [Bacteriovoracaceae bacterium]|nr:PAS domain S-box protein [Bacteriovoracaceae bacterium]
MIKEFFKFSIDLLCIANTKGYFIKVSPSFTSTLGYSEEELLTTPYLDFVHPDDHEKTENAASSLKVGEDLFHFDNRYRCKDGTIKHLSWTCKANDEDHIIYAIARDITAKKEVESRLNNLIKTLSDYSIIAFTDKNGVITEVSDSFCKISRYSKVELIGKTHKVVNSGKHPQKFWKELWSTISSGKTWVGDIQNKAKDGSFYYVYSIISPIINIEGEIEGYFAVRFDRTKEFQFKERLSNTLSILNSTNKIAKVGGWELDLKTKKQSWTEETFNIMEIKGRDGMEPTLEEGISGYAPEYQSIIDEAVREAIENGKSYRLELKALKRKGGTKWVLATGSPFFEDGKIVKLVGTVQDIDNQKKADEKLKLETQKVVIQSRLASIGELAAGVGHEINNPLTIAIGNLLKIKKKASLDESMLKSLNIIEKAHERIQGITSRLRDLSRSGQGKATINLSEILLDSFSFVEDIYKSSDIDISFNDNKLKEVYIKGNRSELQQVFMNLISNAKDASEGKDKRKIAIELKALKNKAIINFVDNGEGVADEIKEKIFDSFYTSKEVGKGTGIGLSISNRIVVDHKGEISFKSKIGKGSTFTVMLPIISNKN